VYYNLDKDARYVYPTIRSVKERYDKQHVKWILLQIKVEEFLMENLSSYNAGTFSYVEDYVT